MPGFSTKVGNGMANELEQLTLSILGRKAKEDKIISENRLRFLETLAFEETG